MSELCGGLERLGGAPGPAGSARSVRVGRRPPQPITSLGSDDVITIIIVPVAHDDSSRWGRRGSHDNTQRDTEFNGATSLVADWSVDPIQHSQRPLLVGSCDCTQQPRPDQGTRALQIVANDAKKDCFCLSFDPHPPTPPQSK